MSTFHSKVYITRGTKISGLNPERQWMCNHFKELIPSKWCIAGWHICFLQEAHTQQDWRGDGWVFGVAAGALAECDWYGTARYLGFSGKTGSFSSNSILLSRAHVLKIPNALTDEAPASFQECRAMRSSHRKVNFSFTEEAREQSLSLFFRGDYGKINSENF